MIKPDDDFDDDFEDDDPVEEVEDSITLESKPTNEKQHDTRRKIEDILERRRLREEFGDLDFD